MADPGPGPLRAATDLVPAVALAATPDPAARGTGRWTTVGVGGGGSMFLPAVSPHDPGTVLLSCDMTGCYLTRDAGASWRNVNLRGVATAFDFDPVDPDVMYASAGTAGLWGSGDRGETWGLLWPDRADVAEVVHPDDHAGTEYVLASGERAGAATAFAVDPGCADRLWLAAKTADEVRLLASADRGATWRLAGSLPDETVRGLSVPPAEPGGRTVVYAVTDHAVYTYDSSRTHAGDSLPRQPGPGGAGDRVSHAIGFTTGSASGSASPLIYWATRSELFVSTDSGATWEPSALPGTGCQLQALAVSASRPEIAYVSYYGLRLGDGEYTGIARTLAAGRDWTLVRADTHLAQDRTDDCWLAEAFGAEWPGYAWGIAVGPHDPDLCYVTDWGSVWKTTDGGLRWSQTYFRRVSDASVTTTGLDVTTNYGVFFDPFDDRRMFIAYTDIGLIRSEDGGRSWIPTTAGIPDLWHNTTYWMVFDPDERGKAWGVMAYDHDLPRPKMWRHRSTETYRGGVCASDDGGRTWRVTSDGMPPTAPTHLLLDPRSPVGSRTLYVTAMGQGVFKSVDGGVHWQLANDGIRESAPLAWRLCLGSDGSLYLVVFRRGENAERPGPDGAVYRSTDGARHWEPMALPDGVNGPAGILADVDDPDRLYLSAWRRDSPDAKAGGGIYLSTDRGLTWRNVLSRDQHIYDVSAHPDRPNHLFATGFESNAWRSTDRGENWERIPGFDFKWAHRVVPDPCDPDAIYVATYGGGVWHGSAYASGG